MVFVYDDISNFVSVDVMVREGLLGFVCMMIFLTFVSVDVMGRFCVSSNSLLLSMCVFGFKRPIGGIGIMGFWGYLLPCQDAVGICRPTFFINSLLDFSTSTKKGVFSCCSLFFSSFLCFPPFGLEVLMAVYSIQWFPPVCWISLQVQYSGLKKKAFLARISWKNLYVLIMVVCLMVGCLQARVDKSNSK